VLSWREQRRRSGAARHSRGQEQERSGECNR